MFLIVAILAVITRYFVQMHAFLSFGVDLAPIQHDEHCELRAPDGMVGSEDMAIGRHGLLFVGSGDVLHIVEHGTKDVASGGIWALDLGGGGGGGGGGLPERLELRGFDQARHGFHAHGLYVSNATDRLYVVNHAHEYSGVEIFRIDYGDDGGGGGGGDGAAGGGRRKLPVLHHQHTIGADGKTFPLRAINDVVEAGGDGEDGAQVYVTQWLPFAVPLAGKKHAATLAEFAASVLAPTLAGLFGIRHTSVLRCDRSIASGRAGGGWQWACAAELDGQFVSANGITIAPDRGSVLVNDPPLQRVSVFGRDKAKAGAAAAGGGGGGGGGGGSSSGGSGGGRLSFLYSFGTGESADNIEWEGGGGEGEGDSVIMGTIPVLHQYVTNDVLGKSEPVAGGARVAHRAPGGVWKLASHVAQRLPTHDGTKLSQTSSAARWGSTVVLGSPTSPGVLVCKL